MMKLPSWRIRMGLWLVLISLIWLWPSNESDDIGKADGIGGIDGGGHGSIDKSLVSAHQIPGARAAGCCVRR